MQLKRKKALEILCRLASLLAKKPAKLEQEDVHRLRTSTRKTESLLQALPAKLVKRSKLAPEMKKLRKRAGAVRDADVQIGLLHGLSLYSAAPGAEEQKQHLLDALHLQRTLGKKRLDKFLDSHASEIRKRLESFGDSLPKSHVAKAQTQPEDNDTLHEAALRFHTLIAAHPILHPSNLHDFRKQCKQIRYLAELGSETPQAQHFLQQLTAIQNAIGTWHDWHTLHALAFSLGMHHNLMVLIQALEDLERHHYARAIQIVENAVKATSALQRKSLAHKKPPASAVAREEEHAASVSA